MKTHGLILAAVLATVAVIAASAQAQPANSPWPMKGRNAQHTGLADAVGPDALNILWSVNIGSCESSPVLGPDGDIYIGSSIGLMRVGKNGDVRWNVNLGDKTYVTPAIAADGTIYVANMMPSQDGRIYAVNSDGTIKWSWLMGTNPRGLASPVIGSDGTVYFATIGGGPQGGVVALWPDGTLRWQKHPPTSPGMGAYFVASPALSMSGSVLYVADDNQRLWALDASTGAELWHRDEVNGIRSSPAIGADGTIYVGTDRGSLCALNPNGSLKWRFSSGSSLDEFFSSPAIAPDGTIVIGCDNKHVYAVNPNGTLKWQFTDPVYDVNGSPLIDADGNIYIEGGQFWTLAPDGALRWTLTGYGADISQPMLDENGVLYTRCSNQLLAITPEPATLSLLAAGLGAMWLKRRRR